MSTSASGSQGMANYDGKGTYIIFNTADTLFISDLNSHDKVFPFLLLHLCMHVMLLVTLVSCGSLITC